LVAGSLIWDWETPALTGTVSKANVSRFEGDELMFQGKLYDVINRTASRDSITLLLYPDEEEQTALSDLGNYFSPDLSIQSSNINQISQTKNFYLIQDSVQPSVIQFNIPVIKKICFNVLLSSFNTISDRHRSVPTPSPVLIDLSYFGS